MAEGGGLEGGVQNESRRQNSTLKSWCRRSVSLLTVDAD